jgi:murein DD-endopeptidase MepM/ murein hydrolase activator NlpD
LGGDVSVPRPRKIVLLVASVATLALLCCGGGLAAALFGQLNDDSSSLTASFGCGKGGPVDPNSKLPGVGSYSPAEVHNAAVIIKTGADLKMPPRAWVIAVATAMQESGLNNLGNLGDENDHDSLGLFQQRPSAGWGTPAQVQDPVYASTKFYDKLKAVPNWKSAPLTKAAQAVQVSAYPDAYAKHEPQATQIVNQLADGAANAAGSSVSMVCASAGQIAASGWTVPVKEGVVSGFRTASRPTHQGVDLGASRGEPILAAASGVVSVVKCDEDHQGRRTCNVDGYPGKGGCGWMVEIQHAGNIMTRYCHMVQRPDVKEGQEVTAGQELGHVGTSGNSSGPHLHFEVHLNDDRSSAGAISPIQFMRTRGAPLGGEE